MFAAFALAAIAFVPLDDRPVTRQLPQLLGRIAGVPVAEPPLPLLGNYLDFGKPDAIVAWLHGSETARANQFVVSADMLAYGGLIASRVPETAYGDAYFRLRSLQQLRRQHPTAWIGVFGTVMRLAPTGIPAVGPAQSFFAPYPIWSYLQEYANLHDPPLPSEEARAAQLRALIGDQALQGYLNARYRDYAADDFLIKLTAAGTIDRLALGQDDAGPVGLHVKDVRALQASVAQAGLDDRVAIEPGADELGMAMVSQAIARNAGWTPRIAVVYSMPGGAALSDPLEFAPIETAINGLIGLCGAVRDDARPDITLFVRVPDTDPAHDDALLAAVQAQEQAGRSVAFADLTFLRNTFSVQAAFAERLLESGAASKLDSYASWNTNANTVGTAVAEAVAAGAGRRAGTYDALAHAEFTFDRIVDDYAFHDFVRPQINAALSAQGITDHTYLLAAQAGPIADLNRAALWNRAAAILKELYPSYHIAAMQITLPWNRTFETGIEVGLAPNL